MRLGSASTTGESVAQLAERLDGLHEMLYPRGGIRPGRARRCQPGAMTMKVVPVGERPVAPKVCVPGTRASFQVTVPWKGAVVRRLSSRKPRSLEVSLTLTVYVPARRALTAWPYGVRNVMAWSEMVAESVVGGGAPLSSVA